MEMGHLILRSPTNADSFAIRRRRKTSDGRSVSKEVCWGLEHFQASGGQQKYERLPGGRRREQSKGSDKLRRNTKCCNWKSMPISTSTTWILKLPWKAYSTGLMWGPQTNDDRGDKISRGNKRADRREQAPKSY